MKHLLLSILFIYSLNGFTQNLVPNPSFEYVDTCPYIDRIEFAVPWYDPTISTPNDLNSCATNSIFSVPSNGWGYQYARTGVGYAVSAVFSDYDEGREYISVKIDSALVAGKSYCVGYFVSLSNCDSTPTYYGSMYAIDRMGAYLSDTAIHLNTDYIIPVNPQIENPTGHFLSDTLNWMLVSGTYVALGGEQYITIGNFYANDSTNYIQVSNSWSHGTFYYIDDVFVYECDAPVYSAEAGNNVAICIGDSVQIGAAPHTQYLYNWQPIIGLSDTVIANPWAKPTATTTYYLKQKDFKFDETKDSVMVTVKNCNDTIIENSFTVPNAFIADEIGMNSIFKAKGQNIKTFHGIIINRWGQKLYEWNALNGGWEGKYKGNDVAPGAYFFVITVTFNDGTIEEKKGSVEVVRNKEN